MAPEIKDGGPAFPTFELERVYADNADRFGRELHVPVGGMSLRDYFAGQALALGGEFFHQAASATPTNIAAIAYEVADAMLKAREASHVA